MIRNPEDAVLSRLVRKPHLSVERALQDYITFYRTIAPYREGFVVAPFDEVTNNFGQVILRVNERFGTVFVPFEHTDENIQKVFALVEEMDKADQKRGTVTETTVARPSAVRDDLKEQLRHKLKSLKSELLGEARNLYKKFMEWT